MNGNDEGNSWHDGEKRNIIITDRFRRKSRGTDRAILRPQTLFNNMVYTILMLPAIVMTKK